MDPSGHFIPVQIENTQEERGFARRSLARNDTAWNRLTRYS
jgi:hypothetical protein